MTETPEPEPTEEQTYYVLFLASVKTSDPGEAVRLLVDQIVETGLRKWTYRVNEGDNANLVGYYDGHGTKLQLPTEDTTPVADDADLSAPSPTLDTETDEADLTAFAENLSQS